MLCIFSQYTWAQSEFQDDTRIFYRDEISVSAGMRSNGFGIGSRYAKRTSALNKRVFEFQATSLHHDKEVKLAADIGGKYVYGKLNSTYQLLFSYGNQKEKFSKLDKGSVSIRFIYNAGLAIALEKPYYYIIDKEATKFELFGASTGSKYGKAPFSKGVDEINVVPGLYLSYAVNFEFSKTEAVFKALEFGVSVQAYPQNLQIMDTNENTWIYPTLFIIYRLGKVLEEQ